MSIELLPFSAFALESRATHAAAPGEGQTLTASATAAGLLLLHAVELPPPASEHASIVPCVDTGPLTLTF